MNVFPIFVVALLFGGLVLMGCTSNYRNCAEEKAYCEFQCGEGVFAGFCKEKCAWDYRSCVQGTPTPTYRPPY